MANIGDRGFFGFDDGENGVAARPCTITGITPGHRYGENEPDRYKVHVLVSTDDDAMLEEHERFAVQPTVGGYTMPRLAVERECHGQATGPTLGGFWIPA